MGRTPQHFLDIADFDSATLSAILADSQAMKNARAGQPRGIAEPGRPLDGMVLAMIFEKPSTRTRVSFDVAMRQLGGETLVLSGSDLQLGHGESIADTARVLSRFVDAIMIRTFGHDKLAELAANASVPVINGLTDQSHPCQVMADVMTLKEARGDLKGKVVAWSGDANNMVNSWVHAAARFDFEMRIAAPEGLKTDPAVLAWARANGGHVVEYDRAEEAVAGADCVVADTWISMHQDDAADRHNLLKPFQVNARLMEIAGPQAIFMHCLPAHRGEDVTDEVIDGPQSVVFDEAENRLHVQKGILKWALGARRD